MPSKLVGCKWKVAMDYTPHGSIESLLSDEPWLQRLAFHLVRDQDFAQDLVQRVRLAALTRPPSPDVPPRPWVLRTMRNIARYERRSSSNRRATERDAARREGSIAPADNAIERLEIRELLLRCVRELDEPVRAAIIARYIDGLPPREIAKRNGEPVKTVQSRLARGLDTLRARLDRCHPDGREGWVLGIAPLLRPSDFSSTLGGNRAPRPIFNAAIVIVALVIVTLGTLLLREPVSSASEALGVSVLLDSPEPARLLSADARGGERIAVRAALVSASGEAADSLDVLVVRADTLKPVIGAAVLWCPFTAAWGDAVSMESAFRECRLEEYIDEQGQPLSTSESGSVAIPRSARGGVIVAVHGELWGKALVRANEPAGFELALRKDAPVEVQIVDHERRPVSGVGVALRGVYGIALTAHPAGNADRLELRHARYVMSEDPGSGWNIAVMAMVDPCPALDIDPLDLPRNPVMLTLGATGACEVRVRGIAGSPTSGEFEVRLRFSDDIERVRHLKAMGYIGGMIEDEIDDQERHREWVRNVSYLQSIGYLGSDNETDWTAAFPALTTDWTAYFPHVQCQRSITAIVNRIGSDEHYFATADGPWSRGRVAVIDVVIDEQMAAIEGVVADSAGSALGNVPIRLLIEREDEIQVERDSRTDESGRFDLQFDARRIRGRVELSVLVIDGEGRAERVARAFMPSITSGGRINVGLLRADLLPIIAQGVVEDADGRPLVDALVFWSEGSEGVVGNVQSPMRWRPVQQVQARTDGAGRFGLRGECVQGLVSLQAKRRGMMSAGTVTVAGTTDAVLRLGAPGNLVGSVLLGPTVKTTDIGVSAICAELDSSYTANLDDAGTFTFRDVAPGRYVVLLEAGHFRHEVDGVLVSAAETNWLEPIDVRNTAHAITIDIMRIGGAASRIEPSLRSTVQGSSRSQEWRVHEGRARLLCGDEPMDITVTSEGFLSEIRRGVVSNARIVLRSSPERQFVLPEGTDLPADVLLTIRMYANGIDYDCPHLCMGQWLRQCGLRGRAATFQADGSARFKADFLGRVQVGFTVNRGGPNGIATQDLPGVIEVDLTEGASTPIPLAIDHEALSKSIAAVRAK